MRMKASGKAKGKPAAKPTGKPAASRSGQRGGGGKNQKVLSPKEKEMRRESQQEEDLERLRKAMDAPASSTFTAQPAPTYQPIIVDENDETSYGNGEKLMRGPDGTLADWAVDARTLEVLEFGTLKDALVTRCKTYRGQGKALKCLENAAEDMQEAKHLYAPVEEIMRLGGGDVVPITGSIMLDNLLAKVEDRFPLEMEELISVGNSLQSLSILEDWFVKLEDQQDISLSHIFEIGDDITVATELREIFEDAFDGEHLSGTKFPQLKSLQNQIQQSEQSIRKQMEGLVKSQEFEGMLESTAIDRINGRFVLCVKPNFKKRVGIAHGCSRTGKTLYIEPFQVIEGTNAMTEADRKLRQEESRILSKMQGLLLKHIDELKEAVDASAYLDLCRAKAILAKDMGGGIVPEIEERGTIEIKEARHPLLALRNIKVVPNDIWINDTYPGLVITGPNAGGKTIVLKTLGLFSLMARIGIPLPAAEGTRIDVFKNVVANIGDSQTSLGDLSTFSGHLSVWANALSRSSKDCLFLMDEMGTGTDPTQGAALAQAMLEAYADTGARIVVSTHYGQIKQFAASDDRFRVSGMMLVEGRPTYKMHDGFASESHAIAMAETLKLPEDIVERAKGLIDVNTREMLNLMSQLQDARDEVERRKGDLKSQQETLRKLQAEVEKKTIELDNTRQTVRAEAAKEYAEELKVKERKLSTLVKELQKQSRKATPGSTQIVGEDIDSLKVLKEEVVSVKEEVREESRPELEKMGYFPLREDTQIRPGQSLAIIDGGTFDKRICAVEKVKGKKIEVTVTRGRIPFKLTLDRYDLAIPSDEVLKRELMFRGPARNPGSMGSLGHAIQKASNKKKKTKTVESTSVELKGIRMPENTIDVRGMTLEEAQEEIIIFLKEAVNGKMNIAYIAHGHGTGENKGLLKNGIRKWLRNSGAPITAQSPAALEDGGDAYTIVGKRDDEDIIFFFSSCAVE
eukprot:CAMPEP_0167746914 /NCGR_PEP_ID=MMETSP0110_2-20121227/3979_1 /TAXON_ID=629695 /ORGANISM="Gymnochlora sp., Strain CCMP2014" /LENGTH=968 /DNA_ID=CAMNT_0007631735 /DNA_START=207 /DNA_END=3111 /DNA_ORIENTATION=+